MCFECDREYDSLADEIALEGRQEWDREAEALREDEDFEDEDFEDEDFEDEYDDSLDGDAASALASAGWGTDEDYGDYGAEY